MAADPPRPQPDLTPRGEAERAARLEREAEALRENLRRRKAQTRARATPPPNPDDTAPQS